MAANALTQTGDKQVLDGADNQKMTVLQPHHFHQVAADLFEAGMQLQERIRQATEQDTQTLQALQRLSAKGLKVTDESIWTEQEGLIVM